MKKWNVGMIAAGLTIASMIFAGSSSAALIDDMAIPDRPIWFLAISAV